MKVDVVPGSWDDAVCARIENLVEAHWIRGRDLEEHCEHLVRTRGEGVDLLMSSIPNPGRAHFGYVKTLTLLERTTREAEVPVLVLTGMPHAHRLMFYPFASVDRSHNGADDLALRQLEEFQRRRDQFPTEAAWKQLHRDALAYADRCLETRRCFIPQTESWMMEGWGILSEDCRQSLRAFEAMFQTSDSATISDRENGT